MAVQVEIHLDVCCPGREACKVSQFSDSCMSSCKIVGQFSVCVLVVWCATCQNGIFFLFY